MAHQDHVSTASITTPQDEEHLSTASSMTPQGQDEEHLSTAYNMTPEDHLSTSASTPNIDNLLSPTYSRSSPSWHPEGSQNSDASFSASTSNFTVLKLMGILNFPSKLINAFYRYY